MAQTNAIPPVPYKLPFLQSNGLVTDIWSKFFQALRERAGGALALTNTELEALITSSTGDATSIHDFTGGQSATNLTGETFDHTEYSSVMLICEIYRGTNSITNLIFALQYIGGSWSVVNIVSGERSAQVVAHGITFTMNGDQLRAAADSGDDGKIRIKKLRFALSA